MWEHDTPGHADGSADPGTKEERELILGLRVPQGIMIDSARWRNGRA